MFYNIKMGSMGENGRKKGKGDTPYYIIRARVRDGEDGIDGVKRGGLMGKGLRDGNRGAGLLLDGGFYWTGERRLQGRGKRVTREGKRKREGQEGKGEKKGKEKKERGGMIKREREGEKRRRELKGEKKEN